MRLQGKIPKKKAEQRKGYIATQTQEKKKRKSPEEYIMAEAESRGERKQKLARCSWEWGFQTNV